MRAWALVVLLMGVLAAGCAPRTPAPWEDRPPPRGTERTTPTPREVPRPDAHRVERGDTLYSIAFRYGLDWRNVASWNRIPSPYTIQPGQLIRLRAPSGDTRIAAEDPPERPTPLPDAEPETRPAGEQQEPSAVPPESTAEPETGTETGTPAPADDPARAPAPVADDAPQRQAGGVSWRWPTAGRVVRAFDAADTRSGIHVGGEPGQSVVAAAGGQVVYSGTGLIGYGELIIIKHSETLLSAYAHNRRRLVVEGDRVGAGQPIAELGTNERGDDILHFEIRRNGQPVNPLDYLPQR